MDAQKSPMLNPNRTPDWKGCVVGREGFEPSTLGFLL